MADASDLVSPPDICVRLLELVEAPDTSAGDIGSVLTQDPNLTARLLRIVNSSYYNFPSRIDTVSRAVTVVGIRELYSLVLAVSAVQVFTRIPAQLVNMDTFWRHSIYCGLIARGLARRLRILHPERLFIAGLLHDIGSLLIYQRVPERARDLLLTAEGDEQILYEAEVKTLGFSHADLGGLMMELWKLPVPLQEAVRFHHSPADADEGKLEAAIVHIAEVLANRSEIGSFCEEPSDTAAVQPEAWAALGMAESDLDVDELIGEAGLQFTESATILRANG
ncbi:MAG: HDOD domain-containing protein [Gammaproteobacteria bacterium]